MKSSSHRTRHIDAAPERGDTNLYHRAHQFYVLSLAIVPIYFGGDRILSWGIAGVLHSGLFLYLTLFSPVAHEPRRPEASVIKFSMLLFSIVILWAGLQIIPLPSLQIAHPVWAMTADILSLPIEPIISVSPDEGVLTIIKFLVLSLVVANGYVIYSHCRKTTELIISIAMIVTGYGLIALIWLQYFPGQHIWITNSRYAGNAVSTFINRNAFAQYLGIGLVCALAITIRHWRLLPAGRNLFHTLQNLISLVFQRSAIYLAIATVLAVTLALTGSRAGVITTILGILTLAILHLLPFRPRNLLIILPACLFMGFAYQMAVPHMAELNMRGEAVFFDWQTRSTVYSEIMAIIMRQPIAGYGLGSFEAVFREAKPLTFESSGIWIRAHNVYLEAWLGLGIPVGTVLIFICFCPAIFHLTRLKQNETTTIGHVVIALTVLAGVHSLFDFSSQVGANAITLAALAGSSLGARKKAVKAV